MSEPSSLIESGAEVLLENEMLRRDRRMHRWSTLVVLAVACGLIAAVVPRDIAWVVLGWLSFFAVTTVVFQAWGSRVLIDAELVVRSLGTIALLVLSGQAMVFLVVTMLGSFLWSGRRRSQWIFIGSHALGAAACVVLGHFASAMVVLLSVGTVVAVQTMVAQALRRSMRARVGRDLLERELVLTEVSDLRERIARELHDGAGSDLTALVMRFRLHAETNSALLPLMVDAQLALEELRTAAWVLKSPQTTVGGLVRLLTASCLRLGGPRCTQAPLLGDVNQSIDPSTATAVARLACELIRCVSGAHTLRLGLDMRSTSNVEVVLEVTGAVSVEAFASVRQAGVSLRIEAQADGLRLSAEVPVPPYRENHSRTPDFESTSSFR